MVESKAQVSDKIKEQVTVINVEDSLGALQKLSKIWRLQLKAQVIAITGSTGKTTTNDILDRVFSTFCVGK